MKNIRFFFIRKFPFYGGIIFSIFEKACFRNVTKIFVVGTQLALHMNTHTICFDGEIKNLLMFCLFNICSV